MKMVIQQVAKHYRQKGRNQVTALDNINLNIRQGEFICLVGPSGCGKTTLLNIVAGLEQADCGRVFIDNEPIKGAGADRVVVFQEAALFPWLTVLQNVEFGLKMLGVKKETRRNTAGEYLEMVNLLEFVHAYPHELSGGMKQRVAIARALAMNPKILLMDEPFAALDPQTRSALHRDLQQIWERTGKTVLFVTHNVAEATCLADRVILLSSRPGRIKREFKIKLPRPRNENDFMLQKYQREIMDCLKDDLEVQSVSPAESRLRLDVKQLASTLD